MSRGTLAALLIADYVVQCTARRLPISRFTTTEEMVSRSRIVSVSIIHDDFVLNAQMGSTGLVGFDPDQATAIVAHEGTNISRMYAV